MPRVCPVCLKLSEDNAAECECGYVFDSGEEPAGSRTVEVVRRPSVCATGHPSLPRAFGHGASICSAGRDRPAVERTALAHNDGMDPSLLVSGLERATMIGLEPSIIQRKKEESS